MNIGIIKNTKHFDGISLKLNTVLQTIKEESEYPGILSVRYYLYQLDTVERVEICPNIKKYQVISIINASTDNEYVFFCSCYPLDNGKHQINLIRYHFASDNYEIVYTFEDDISLYEDSKRMKAFVLDINHVIFQTEYLRSNATESCTGFFDFELTLYSMNEQMMYPIYDENFVNNGIDMIVGITQNLCAIKTGFSLLMDNRYQLLDKSEVSVEGISFANTQQLISDLKLKQRNIVIDAIDQAYYNKTFPYLMILGEYLIYSKVDNETKEEEVYFYHYMNKTVKTCINQNVESLSNLAKPYVIGGIPYIRLDHANGTEFVNLNTTKSDAKFNSDVTVEAVINNLFIVTTESKKNIIKKSSAYISVYQYPQMTILHREKAEYTNCISTGKDDIYIFVN